MRNKLIAVIVCALAVKPALAQIDKYDPNTGKYVTSDPFAQPAPAAPNPYRVNPRTANGGSFRSAPAVRQLPGAAVAGTGGSASVAAPASPQQLVPMDGMAMYDSDTSPADPFAKPDWWPQ